MTGNGDVLFFDVRYGSDFTMDAVWAGLVNRFGPLRIVDYGNCREKHRAGVPQVTGDVEKDYGAERRSLCYTSELDRMWSPEYSLDVINGMIKKGAFSWIFIDERIETYQLYLQTIARFFDIPVIVIAGHDRFWNDGIGSLYGMYGRNLKAIFADNWRPEWDQNTGRVPIFPMNYATNFDHLWDVGNRKELLKNKVYDVCFMGYNSHGDRTRYIDHILEKYSSANNCIMLERRNGAMDLFLPKREYFQRMAQSRVCINLRGAAESGKALRFYEIPYVGSFMLSQEFGGKQIDPYINQQDCVYFNDIEGLDRSIEWALSNPEERERIAKNGLRHSRSHTAGARVEYIYKCLGYW